MLTHNSEPARLAAKLSPYMTGKTGSLLGQKIILNEFAAFASFADLQGGLSEHSRIVTTFALCGFANLATPTTLRNRIRASIERGHSNRIAHALPEP